MTLGARRSAAPGLRRPHAARTGHRGWHSRGYLPHFDAGGVFQFVTYRLGDSLPASVVARLDDALADLPEDERALQRRIRIDDHLDQGRGCCCLRQPECAQVVCDAWQHFAGARYDLCAWVVMPNHVHVLIRAYEGYPLPEVVRSWKHFTAMRINRLRGSHGHFWQNDHWDRFIRDEAHFARTVAYIHENPVKAGLVATTEAWRWSSAGFSGGVASHEARCEAPRSGALPE